MHGGLFNFKFNLIFYNILVYNRVTFNNRVACYFDFISESWQPVEASCKGFHKIIVFKILTNRKTELIV